MALKVRASAVIVPERVTVPPELPNMAVSVPELAAGQVVSPVLPVQFIEVVSQVPLVLAQVKVTACAVVSGSATARRLANICRGLPRGFCG